MAFPDRRTLNALLTALFCGVVCVADYSASIRAWSGQKHDSVGGRSANRAERTCDRRYCWGHEGKVRLERSAGISPSELPCNAPGEYPGLGERSRSFSFKCSPGAGPRTSDSYSGNFLPARRRPHHGCPNLPVFCAGPPFAGSPIGVRVAPNAHPIYKSATTALQSLLSVLYGSSAAAAISARHGARCFRWNPGIYTHAGVGQYLCCDLCGRHYQSSALDLDGSAAWNLACNSGLLQFPENHGKPT